MITEFTNMGARVVGVLIAIWVAFKIAGWLDKRVSGILKARKFDEALSIFMGSLVRWAVIVMAVLACLGVFGVDTTSFAAVIGAAGLAVGLVVASPLGDGKREEYVVTGSSVNLAARLADRAGRDRPFFLTTRS